MKHFAELSFDDWDDKTNTRAEAETDFSLMLSRRSLLGGGWPLAQQPFCVAQVP
jgi:hypothetical protein